MPAARLPKVKLPADVGEIGRQIGIPPGKKMSVRNMAIADPNSAKRRRPKPGQSVNPAYSY
jgi:hypothetical protein